MSSNIHTQCQYVANNRSECQHVAKRGGYDRKLLKIVEPKWNEAYRRSIIFASAGGQSYCPRHQALEAATTLGLSVRQVYRLIRKLRERKVNSPLYYHGALMVVEGKTTGCFA